MKGYHDVEFFASPKSLADKTIAPASSGLSRRRFTAYLSGLGLTSTLLTRTLWAQLQEEKATKITKEMLREAERLAGLDFTDQERDLMLDGLNDYLERYRKLRTVALDNSVRRPFASIRSRPERRSRSSDDPSG